MTLQWACEPFATEADVLAAPGGCPFEVGDDVQSFIDQASDILFQLTGGRVHGRCTSTVYPVADIDCFGRAGGSWRFPWATDGYVGATIHHGHPSMSDQFGGRLPVVLDDDNTHVTEVNIDGTALDANDYVLVNGKYLVRKVGSWPTTNDITQVSGTGTWSITVTYGTVPDVITRDAAVQMAIELAKTYGIGKNNGWAPGVISANIQGVQVSIDDLTDAIRAGRMQVPAIDRFLGIYAPDGRQQNAVYSPELMPYQLMTVSFS